MFVYSSCCDWARHALGASTWGMEPPLCASASAFEMHNSGHKTEICFECLGHFLPLPAAWESFAQCISSADLSNTHTSWGASSARKSSIYLERPGRHQLAPEQRAEPVGRPHDAAKDDSEKCSPSREHICGHLNPVFLDVGTFKWRKGDTEAFGNCTVHFHKSLTSGHFSLTTVYLHTYPYRVVGIDTLQKLGYIVEFLGDI